MFQTAELQDEYGSASSDWQLAEVQTPQAAVEAALHAALVDGTARTRDVGGTATTLQYTRAVVARLA